MKYMTEKRRAELEATNTEPKLSFRKPHRKVQVCTNPLSVRDVKIHRKGEVRYNGFIITFDSSHNSLKIYCIEHNLMKTIFNIMVGDIIRMDFHIDRYEDDVFPKIKFIRHDDWISMVKGPIEIAMPSVIIEGD